MADGGLLALIACLGLAQLSHETTPALAQVGFTALELLCASPRCPTGPSLAALWPVRGPGRAGAERRAGDGAAVRRAAALLISLLDRDATPRRGRAPLPGAPAAILAAALLRDGGAGLAAGPLALAHRRRGGLARDWRALGRLLLWFTWPAWPLALWTLWRWRRQLVSRHVALPLWFALVAVVTTWITPSSDRSLLLALPALATLAAFALPTLERSVSRADRLVHAAVLQRLRPRHLGDLGFHADRRAGQARRQRRQAGARLRAELFAAGFRRRAGRDAAWAWLVRWRTGRHRVAIWKSLVLPAGGAALCWLLLMTLWLPVLDFARSYAPVVRGVMRHIDQPGCVEVFGLNRGQIAAFRYHGQMDLRPASREGSCPWLLAAAELQPALAMALDMRGWQLVSTVRAPRPTPTTTCCSTGKRLPGDRTAHHRPACGHGAGRPARRDGLRRDRHHRGRPLFANRRWLRCRSARPSTSASSWR